jgi:two-component system LytT family response regulator
MMLRALIVDDEPLARQLVRELLAEEVDVEVVAECAGGGEAVREIRRLRPDLVFLDIQMPGLSGLDVLAELSGPDGRGEAIPYVIFVTAHDRYAIQAFEVQAVDYLLKPVARDRFERSVARARRALQERNLVDMAAKLASVARSYAELQARSEAQRGEAPRYRGEFILREGGTIRKLLVARIHWIEAANQYVRLHAETGSHLLAESLAGLERELDPQHFCRIHRSAMVNMAFVREVRSGKGGTHTVVLADGTRLRVSRGRRSALQHLIDRV